MSFRKKSKVYSYFVFFNTTPKFLYNLLFLTICLTIISCSSLINVDPPFTSINKANVFDNDATATAVLTDIFAQLSNANSSLDGDIANLFLYTGLTGDELELYALDNSSLNIFYYNALTQNSNLAFWNSTYSRIFATNSTIEGLSSNTKLTSAVKKQLLGEAKFIRAFCYFYLVNLYGDVPLVITTDPLKNALLPRSSVEVIYNQIFEDLNDAQSLLSDDFRSGNVLINTSERTRPTKWAAKALLARAYLYIGSYDLAQEQSTDVINMNSLFKIDSLDDVFLKNSNECIWQLQDVYKTRGNTGEGNLFILPETGPDISSYPVYLSSSLVNSFEGNDKRKSHWIDSTKVDSNLLYYYAYKYKSGTLTPNDQITEYEMVLRLGEQFLIRAEARAKLGNIQEAEDDLNVIRRRAGLKEISIYNKDQLISAILHERQVELFTEWGHRWFDLKRTNTLDSVMNKVTLNKGIVWNPNWALWPINLTEIIADPKLVQNKGY